MMRIEYVFLMRTVT